MVDVDRCDGGGHAGFDICETGSSEHGGSRGSVLSWITPKY